MKKMILTILVMGLAKASFGWGPSFALRTVEMKSYRLQPAGLTEKIVATFEVKCYQKIHKVIRENLKDDTIPGVQITVGALVLEDYRVDCMTPPKEVEVDAGAVYSGQKYEITNIRVK